MGATIPITYERKDEDFLFFIHLIMKYCIFVLKLVKLMFVLGFIVLFSCLFCFWSLAFRSFLN